MAREFHARHAVMLVHSFSPTREWSDDYRTFAKVLGGSGSLDGLVVIPGHDEPTLSVAWASDKIANV
jgi:hypothetical protein